MQSQWTIIPHRHWPMIGSHCSVVSSWTLVYGEASCWGTDSTKMVIPTLLLLLLHQLINSLMLFLDFIQLSYGCAQLTEFSWCLWHWSSCNGLHRFGTCTPQCQPRFRGESIFIYSWLNFHEDNRHSKRYIASPLNPPIHQRTVNLDITMTLLSPHCSYCCW